MVTQQMLNQMRSEQRKPSQHLDYTPTGMIVRQVQASVDKEQSRSHGLAEKAFKDAFRDMRREQALSRSGGYSKAQFNQSTGGPKL
tara:strand:- start:2383 stop:2640 length:258 start_codon:yes stop_codon:yes gene_type:complete